MSLHQLSCRKREKMVLKLASCQRFVELILQFKRGGTCHQELYIWEIIRDSFQNHPDILYPLSLVYHNYKVVGNKQTQLRRICLCQQLSYFRFIAIQHKSRFFTILEHHFKQRALTHLSGSNHDDSLPGKHPGFNCILYLTTYHKNPFF